MKKLQETQKLNLRYASISAALILLFGCLINAFAQKAEKHKIAINDLINETQQQTNDPNRMQLVWWIPEEYWDTFLKSDPTSTEESREEFLKTLRPYVLVMVVDGKIGTFGSVKYKTESEIQAELRLKDSQGMSFRPLSQDKVDSDTKTLLAMIKPITANMLGPMGENMHFFLFQNKNAKGQRIVEAAKKGNFSILAGSEEYKWRLPLSSLVPPKICSKCAEKCSGTWNYCPWCGTVLPNI